MPSTLSEAKFWSTMDPSPVIFYDKKNDAHLACWNGLLMTHKQALVIASSIFYNIWPSPKMKASIFEEFKRLYYSNAFGTKSWDTVERGADNHFKYLHVKIFQHFKDKLENKYEMQDVLKWFDKKELQHD